MISYFHLKYLPLGANLTKFKGEIHFVISDCYEMGIKFEIPESGNTTNIAQNCQALCNKKEGCLFFSWDSQSKNCYVTDSSEHPNESSNDNFISGPKLCGKYTA